MNGRNGNILEGYYRNQNKPTWSLVLSICTLLLALLAVVYYTNEKITDLKIENTTLKLRNEMQRQIMDNRYAPDTPFVGE